MKAIYIKNVGFGSTSDLSKLNNELKDCNEIVWSKEVDQGMGHLLIFKNTTRKDKLEKIDEISNAGTNNNSI